MRTLLRWVSVPVSSWWLDFKLGARMLFKYPGLALAGGAGIAVAVAISTCCFSIVRDNILATSLPLDEGDRLVSIEMWDAAANKPERHILRDFQSWRAEELRAIRELSAFRTVTPNLIMPGVQPGSVRVASMTASGFGVARVRPLMGRYFTEDDEREGAPPVIVIGESVWRNRFASDPAILGRSIQLGATMHSIIGVMPKGFAFPVNHQFWTPLRARGIAPEPLAGPEVLIFGRLAPAATFEMAQAEMTASGKRTALEFPKAYRQLRPQAMPYPRPFFGVHSAEDIAGVLLMHSVLTLLLVLVCLNVAILVYTRTALRQAEISIRTALGAKRGRIVGQLFIEALVLSIAGAAAGIALASLALRTIANSTLHLVSELPFWLTFQLSSESVFYAVGLSVVAAAIVGIVPALKATSGEVQTGLRVIGSGGSGMRLGKTWTVLIVAQVGFAVAFLPAAVYTTWSEIRNSLAGPGFAAEEFLTAQLGMDYTSGTSFGQTGMREFGGRYADRQEELQRRLRAEALVTGVTFASAMPGDERRGVIEAQGALSRTEDSASSSGHQVRVNHVDLNFFGTFEVPVLAGRGFEAGDVAVASGGAEVPALSGTVIVNQSLAQRVFGGSALGRQIRYAAENGAESGGGGSGGGGRWYEIVGVVSDFPPGVSPGMKDSPLKVYHAVSPGQLRSVFLAVRVRGGAAAATFTRRLSEIAAAVDPDLQLRDVVGMDEALRSEQWISRLQATMFAAVTLSVLTLSSAGIYALMSFTISQRRKEIGIRLALGADRRNIVTSIFSRALVQLASGAVLGLLLAGGLEKVSGESLMGGNAAIVMPGVAVFMIAIGFLAAIGPARRGLRIQPTEALREQ
jgi:putative ABC transport system permease protein